jgi:hypothetical protein
MSAIENIIDRLNQLATREEKIFFLGQQFSKHDDLDLLEAISEMILMIDRGEKVTLQKILESPQ